MSVNNYNTMVSFGGTLVGTIISFGIGAGFRAVLKQRIKRRQGINVVWYEALVHFSWMSVQARWRWTAALSVPLFLLNQTFSAASQAAFGASDAVTSFDAPWSFARLSQNLDAVSQSNFQLLVYPYDSGDLINMAHLRYAEFDDERPLVMLDGNRLYAGQDDPLVSPSVFDVTRYYLNLSASAVETASDSTADGEGVLQADLSGLGATNLSHGAHDLFDSDMARMFNAGTKAWQQAPVEGFLSDFKCADYNSTYVNVTFSAVADAGVIVGSFDFGDCGQKLAVYDNNASIADVYACNNGSPDIYFIFISDTSAFANSTQNTVIDGELNLTFSKCSLASVSSGMYVVSKYERGGTSIMQVKSEVPDTLVDIPPNFQLVSFMGQDLLNNFGQQGWAGLAQSLSWVFALDSLTQTNVTRVNLYLERLCERLVKATLALMSGALAVEGDSIGSLDGLNLVTTKSDFTFFMTAIQIHLESFQLFWLFVPVLLLLIQLALSYHVFIGRRERVDFTDPVTTAFIGMASHENVLERHGNSQWLTYNHSDGKGTFEVRQKMSSKEFSDKSKLV
ncbi:hypothetical protein ACM66B_001316 [Microbotryomycetes sp. NB124-2]